MNTNEIHVEHDLQFLFVNCLCLDNSETLLNEANIEIIENFINSQRLILIFFFHTKVLGKKLQMNYFVLCKVVVVYII